MAPLPEVRLGTSLHCFVHCGDDFAGPFVIKLHRKVTTKRYLCLFTCASTRAVHLETAGFQNVFPRMVGRCEKPEVMISAMARTSRHISGSPAKSDPIDFRTKNSFPLFFDSIKRVWLILKAIYYFQFIIFALLPAKIEF